MVSPEKIRRDFTIQGFKWILSTIILLLCYPLYRFIGFKVKPKPRHIQINKLIKQGSFHVERDFLIFMGDKGPWAVSRTCTHLGCRVNYRENLKMIVCPCHQSKFTPEGKLITGPAKSDLPRLLVETKKDNDGVINGYVVTI